MVRIPRRSGTRGFTLLEVAIVAAITGILLLLLLRWVTSLVGTSTSNLDVTAVQRDLAYATDQFRSDLEKAEGCDQYGLDVPLRDLDRTSIQLWADVNGDGKKDVIAWRTQGDQLQRAVVPGDGTCTFDVSTPQYRALVGNVQSGSGTVFVGHRGGQAYSSDADYPPSDCQGMNAETCLYDAVAMTFTIRSAGEDQVPFTTEALYPVNLSGSRLAP